MIPQEFIQSLLGRVDIVDVVDRYVKLRKAGANLQACCPFHNEKTPSFTVSPSKQFYHCFGCGAHGNAIGFLMEYSGLAYPEAIRALAEQVGMEVPETRAPVDRARTTEAQNLAQRMTEALSYYRAELKKSREAIDYLKGRGLSGEVAARYGLGYAPEGWQNLAAVFTDYGTADLKDTGLVIDSEPDEAQGKKSRRYDRFRHRVMFPILDGRGNVIGFGGRVIGAGEPKYLNSPETPLFEKGRELYGLYQARRAIRDRNEVVVVEGYMDVVALAQHGVENAVATLGTSTTPHHVAKLLKLADNVVFCFDGDAAGRKAAWRALEVALPELADGKLMSFLFLPVEDDPDTFVRREGKDAFLRAAGQAKPLSQFLFGELASHVDMTTGEGRARFLSQARPLLEHVKAPALSAMLRHRLAELAQLDAPELDRLVPGPVPAPASRPGSMPRRGAPARTPRKPMKGLEAQLLGRVLARPEIALGIPDEILDARTPAGAALAEAVMFFRAQPGATLGQASAHFEGTQHQPAIAEALDEPLLNQVESPDFDLVAEGRDLVERMLAAKRARRSAELLPLVAGGTATPEQKAEYEALIARLSLANQGNAGTGERSKL
ncbi:MAG TPA: DNA primase [Usitatibacter sp.]|jgi:DNA primase|nr:DNA primase [Usitatibacter sp.]